MDQDIEEMLFQAEFRLLILDEQLKQLKIDLENLSQRIETFKETYLHESE